MQDLGALYEEHLHTFLKRFQATAMATGKEGCLIASGSIKTAFLDDHPYPFKVNPHFKSLLPVTSVPDSFVLLRGDDKPILLFHQPADYWHMSPKDPTGFWVNYWDIQFIDTLSDVHNHLGDIASLAFIGEAVGLAESWGFNHINNAQMLTSLHYARSYKTDYELACLRAANQLAVDGHRAAEQAFRQGCSELEIHYAYLSAIKHREQQTPYSSIVALNEHAAILHYQHYDLSNPPVLHSLLIDAGANYHGYGSDITRTYAYNQGIFSDLINAMDEAQLGIIKDISIGMNYAELNERMHHRIADILQQFDLVRMNSTLMVEKNITSSFMPHGLGHFLGLQTHDVAGLQQSSQGEVKAAPDKYPALRLTRPIEERQVFTIEPGLYFIPMLLNNLKQASFSSKINWQLIEQLIPCGGIRIEDNIAILSGQPVNLTREALL